MSIYYEGDKQEIDPSTTTDKNEQLQIACGTYNTFDRICLARNLSITDEARAILEADPSPLIKFALVKGYPVWDDPDWFKLGKRITDGL